ELDTFLRDWIDEEHRVPFSTRSIALGPDEWMNDSGVDAERLLVGVRGELRIRDARIRLEYSSIATEVGVEFDIAKARDDRGLAVAQGLSDSDRVTGLENDGMRAKFGADLLGSPPREPAPIDLIPHLSVYHRLATGRLHDQAIAQAEPAF